jgi:hypothetical protein
MYERHSSHSFGQPGANHETDHAQGTSAAFEDAASLAMFLSPQQLGSRTNGAVEVCLEKWNTFRHHRACTVQLMCQHGPQPLESFVDRIRNEVGYEGPLPVNTNHSQKPVQTFCFAYDVRKETAAFIERGGHKVSTVEESDRPGRQDSVIGEW